MTHSDFAFLEKLDGFIDKNLDNPSFSVDDVCLELGVSRSQLHRVLIDRTQLSTTLYIRKRRLEKAKYLLTTTNLRISEISDTVGINSHPNFSKYFIEEFNASPTEFRKQVQEEKLVDDIIEPILIPKPSIFIENQFEVSIEKKPVSRNVYVFIALFALLGIAYYFIDRLGKSENSSEIIEQTENSVAILPFKNLGDTTNSYFSEGVMEQIHSSLASLNDLKIISTTSSNKYANTKKTIPQIAQELHVNYLLSGTVLQVEKQVRITVELIRATDDRVVWTKNFEGDTKNIFVYMNTVSKEVAGELHQNMNSIFTNKLDKKPTESLEAYKAFLQGQQLIQTRTREKIEASIIKFDNALKLDPTFADAYSNKAVAYFLIGEDQFMDVQTAYKLSEKNALTAIKLDAENGRAYAVLGNIYKAQNKWEQALTTYQIALKYSPNDAQITYWYSLTLRSIGKMDEAIKYSTKAVSLDPLASNIYGGHIIGCAYAGRFDLAEKATKEGELIFDNAVLFHNAKASYFLTLGNYEMALEEVKICEKIDDKTVYYKTMIAFLQAKLGNIQYVNSYLKTLPKIPEYDKNFAIVYAGLKDKNNCLKYLESAAENSDSPNYLKTSPLFTFLHNEPRFEAVLQKLGLLNPAFLTR